jgi:hypothetical protein
MAAYMDTTVLRTYMGSERGSVKLQWAMVRRLIRLYKLCNVFTPLSACKCKHTDTQAGPTTELVFKKSDVSILLNDSLYRLVPSILINHISSKRTYICHRRFSISFLSSVCDNFVIFVQIFLWIPTYR